MTTKFVGAKSLVVINGKEYVVEGIRVSSDKARLSPYSMVSQPFDSDDLDSYELSPNDGLNYEDDPIDEDETGFFDCND